MSMNRKVFTQGVRDGVPICLGYIAVSFTFGIMARSAGVSSAQAVLMSATNLTSAGQFAGLTVIASAGSFLEMALTQLIINLRYFLMSCALSQKLSPQMPFFHRFFIAAGITDEVFGVSVNIKEKLQPGYIYGVLCLAIPGWSLGTLLGTISGSLLPERILSALGVALYGMFLAVIIPAARDSRVIAGVILLAMLASLAFEKLPFINISGGMKIIILTVVIAGGAAYLFPIKEVSDEG